MTITEADHFLNVFENITTINDAVLLVNDELNIIRNITSNRKITFFDLQRRVASAVLFVDEVHRKILYLHNRTDKSNNTIFDMENNIATFQRFHTYANGLLLTLSNKIQKSNVLIAEFNLLHYNVSTSLNELYEVTTEDYQNSSASRDFEVFFRNKTYRSIREFSNYLRMYSKNSTNQFIKNNELFLKAIQYEQNISKTVNKMAKHIEVIFSFFVLQATYQTSSTGN